MEKWVCSEWQGRKDDDFFFLFYPSAIFMKLEDGKEEDLNKIGRWAVILRLRFWGFLKHQQKILQQFFISWNAFYNTMIN